MRFSSKQLFPLFFLLFFFPLPHASKPKKCSSSRDSLKCGPSEVSINFPFCDHPGFSLIHCNHLDKTILQLPFSGAFLVQDINYITQKIYISDPDKCLAKRLLTFNISGTPFSYPLGIGYTFFTCPKEVVLPSRIQNISCLSNSTTSFYGTTNFVQESSGLFSSCQIVKRFHGPKNLQFEEKGFPTYLNNPNFMLEWHSPNCSSCARYLRCGLKNKASLEVKCFRYKEGISNETMVTIMYVCIPGGIVFLLICLCCISCFLCDSDSGPDPRRRMAARKRIAAIVAEMVAQQPREVIGMRSQDQSIIESYKKMVLDDIREFQESNGTVCSICLWKYMSTDTVRFLPECNHCFHVQCIDLWFKIDGSCPLCRSSRV